MPRLPIITPLRDTSFEEAAQSFSKSPGFFAIDARRAHESAGRLSIVSAMPASSFSIAGGFVTVDGHTTIESPYAALCRFCAKANELTPDPYLPFSGGIAGYIGFEGARAFRGLMPAKGFSRHPQCRLGLYPTALLFDHAEGTAMLVSNGSTSHEANARSQLFLEQLEAGRKDPRLDGIASPSHGGVRIAPDAAETMRVLASARAWLRSDSVRHVHVVRHGQSPFATSKFIRRFLDGQDEEALRAIFTHEGAAYLATSWDALLRIEGRSLRSTLAFEPHAPRDASIHRDALREFERRLAAFCTEEKTVSSRQGAGPGRVTFRGTLGGELTAIDALVGLIPSLFTTGIPDERALDFIDKNERIHRSLYGGAFGTLDARGLSFQTIQRIETAADGTLGTTMGIDLTSDLDVGDTMTKFDSLLSSSLPRTG